jgi:hypothetical protein
VSEQPVIDDATGNITFKVMDATDEEIQSLTPTIEISPKATITPESGVKADFTSNVKYTVTAEDGTEKVYIASIMMIQHSLWFPLDEWKTSGTGAAAHDEPANEQLGTSGTGGALLVAFYGANGFPIYKTEDAVAGGYAAKLVTVDTSDILNSLVPAITAGSLFTGKFELNILDRISSAKFGIPYSGKPVSFNGWYKYTPGEKYINGEGAKKPEDVVVVPGAVDECAIQAVLYEAHYDDKGEEIPLTGHDINSSDYRVAVARLADGSAKSTYTKFEIPFEYLEGKSYDPAKEYRLAIVCSSSKEGDFFKGAGGSTLYIDELNVIGAAVTAGE